MRSEQRYGQGQRDEPEQTLRDLWPNYLQAGYFTAPAGPLVLDYVSRDQVGRLAQAMAQARHGLTSNQLRRFFGHSRAIEADLRATAHCNSGDDQWLNCAASFHKLDVAAADALSKEKIPRLFHDFIQANVRAVRTGRDFLDGFMPHFEALVGFGSKYFKDERR